MAMSPVIIKVSKSQPWQVHPKRKTELHGLEQSTFFSDSAAGLGKLA